MSETAPQASDWAEWKEHCAFLKCSEEAQGRLGFFGVTRMRKRLGVISESLVKKLNGEENPSQSAWHWLDVHVIQKDARSGLHGKACKDWLFDKENLATTSDLEKYMSTGFFRSAAQDFAKENLGVPTSLDQPVGSDEGGATLGALLEGVDLGQAFSTELMEFAERVRAIATEVFDSLKAASKIALAGTELGVTLDAPEIKKLSGKGKSALYDHVKRANQKTYSVFDADESFGEYDGASFGGILPRKLAETIISITLGELAIEWAKNPENAAEILFEL